MQEKQESILPDSGLHMRVSRFFSSTAGRILKIVTGLGVLTGGLVVIGNNFFNLQEIIPNLRDRYYYGVAAKQCDDKAGYPGALRDGNLPLIRCYIEKQGRSANDLLPADGKMANHPPLVVATESCPIWTIKYLVNVAGADPRLGHRYDLDLSRKAYDTPSGRCFDIPRDVALSKCIGSDPDHPLRSDGPDIVAFLQQAENRLDTTGRDVAGRNDQCPAYHHEILGRPQEKAVGTH